MVKKFVVSGTLSGKRVIISGLVIRSRSRKDARKRLTKVLISLFKRKGVRLGNPRLVEVI